MGPPHCGAPLLASTSPPQPVERRYVQIRSPPVQVHPTNGTWGSPRKSDAHPCNDPVLTNVLAYANVVLKDTTRHHFQTYPIRPPFVS